MQYQYWLSNIEGIGPVTIHKLLKQTGSAETLYFLSENQLDGLSGLGKKEKERILESRRNWNLTEAWEAFLETGISFVSWEMEQFPEKLRYIDNPPYSIYYKGELPDLKRMSVAIVGARRCSEYGRYMAEKIAEKLGLSFPEGGYSYGQTDCCIRQLCCGPYQPLRIPSCSRTDHPRLLV